jgi:signal transduction histidine kinase
MVEIEGDWETLMDSSLIMTAAELMRNAATYSGRDSIVVDIEETMSGCEVSISDRGKEIPPEMRVSEMGFSHGETAGRGMGLYLGSRVVDKNGGEPSILPKDPEGTVIRIEIPRGVNT